jgi:hypothetical protein
MKLKIPIPKAQPISTFKYFLTSLEIDGECKTEECKQ